MGACYCRPQTLVTEDPNVVVHAEVGYCVRLGPRQSDFEQLSAFGGMAYVKEGHLFLESTVGSRFCCLCCREAWELSKIKDVDVVTGNIMVTRRDRYGGTHTSTEVMNPGLQIQLKNTDIDNDRIVMQMPDAVNFCARLRQCCNLSSNANQQLLLNATLQAIVRALSPAPPPPTGLPPQGGQSAHPPTIGLPPQGGQSHVLSRPKTHTPFSPERS